MKGKYVRYNTSSRFFVFKQKQTIALRNIYILHLTLFEGDKTWAICARPFWKYQNLKNKASLLNAKIINHFNQACNALYLMLTKCEGCF